MSKDLFKKTTLKHKSKGFHYIIISDEGVKNRSDIMTSYYRVVNA